jgi:hypothetical protein
VDQVGDPVPDRSGNEQSRQRLFRRISAYRSPCTGALLINRGGGLTRLGPDVASDTLDRIYRLNSGSRHFASQVGGLINGRRGALLQISEHGLGLIDLVVNRFFRLNAEITDGVLDLCPRIAHDSLTLLLIHRLLPTQMAFSPVSAAKQIHEPKHSICDRPIIEKSLGDLPAAEICA